MGVVTNADGCLFCCDEECLLTPTPTPAYDSVGRRVYELRNSSQFILVIEADKGLSGSSVGENLIPLPPSNRPDLQIQADRDLGNGSVLVCDTGSPPSGGGIPGIAPPSFDVADATVTDALSDFACRFQVRDRGAPCTISGIEREARFIDSQADLQFCNPVASTSAFPPGDTLVTAKVRDIGGQLGAAAEIVVRITPAQ